MSKQRALLNKPRRAYPLARSPITAREDATGTTSWHTPPHPEKSHGVVGIDVHKKEGQ
jgi:hypothetical protein